MSDLWRIEQLSALVDRALERSTYGGQDSARVREVPDVRTIRYYTTIGLLDRPQEMRGRTAFYGRRHLWQLVAVKKLQAEGMSLVDVQAALAGASNRKLQKLAGLPADFFEKVSDLLAREPSQNGNRPAAASSDVAASDVAAGRARFWEETPICAGVAELEEEALGARPAVVVPLQPGISLMIDGQFLPQAQQGNEWIQQLRPALDSLREAIASLCLQAAAPKSHDKRTRSSGEAK